MRTIIVIALIILSLGTFITELAIAGGTYRWIDPVTGITRLNSSPPPYQIKRTQINGNFIDVIIDQDDPKVKTLKETEQQRLKVEEEKARDKERHTIVIDVNHKPPVIPSVKPPAIPSVTPLVKSPVTPPVTPPVTLPVTSPDGGRNYRNWFNLVFISIFVAWIIIVNYRKQKHRKQERRILLLNQQIGEKAEALRQQIEGKARAIRNIIKQSFLVQSCPKCHESTMRLIEFSPNVRSIHYQCTHCNRKMRAAAGTPNTPQILVLWNDFTNLVDQYNEITRLSPITKIMVFETPSAPLPYEQTSRAPIPEAARSEVWRRDGGCCVKCGSKENLQFDHIIPVARGGATSVQNLQLLCQQCNRVKGARI